MENITTTWTALSPFGAVLPVRVRASVIGGATRDRAAKTCLDPGTTAWRPPTC